MGESGPAPMLRMSEDPTEKTLKKRTAEFVTQRKGLDKETLVDFVKEVLEPQATVTVTAHRSPESGDIDCICLGDLCAINYVPTESMLGCKRLQWLLMGEVTEEERKRREDHVEV